ncbi:hypothetical protein D3C73_771170 [compost metagenome]
MLRRDWLLFIGTRTEYTGVSGMPIVFRIQIFGSVTSIPSSRYIASGTKEREAFVDTILNCLMLLYTYNCCMSALYSIKLTISWSSSI